MGNYKEFKLKGNLANYIDCVWKENYKHQFEKTSTSYLVVPDNTVELVFTSNTIERTIECQNRQHSVKSHMSGLKTRPQKVKIDGEILLCVRFKPYGVYPFTKVNLKQTINQSILPEDIFGPEIIHLENQLFNCKNDREQLGLIENFFTERLYKINTEPDSIFDFFIQKILFYKGNINIESLAKDCNISKKTIERKFIDKLGITPKKYCRIIRMFNALKIKDNGRKSKLLSIALDNGFYDQAHFIKEVKYFTGMIPKNYFKMDRAIQKHIFLS